MKLFLTALLLGLLFGVGWGLTGYCPGPALASLALGVIEPLLFCGAMLAGMAVFELLEKAQANAGLSNKSGAP